MVAASKELHEVQGAACLEVALGDARSPLTRMRCPSLAAAEGETQNLEVIILCNTHAATEATQVIELGHTHTGWPSS